MRSSRALPRAPLAAWLGAAAFVASLAYFFYFYFVRQARPAASGGNGRALAGDFLLFGAFALHHSILARTGAKRWLTARVPARFERTLYVWISSALFAAVCGWWQPLAGELYRHTGLAAAPHWIAVTAGLWFTFRAAGALDPLELAGVRQAAGDLRVRPFKIVGPYRVVRHPIYLGWFLLVFGVPHMTATRLAFAVISSIYLLVAIPFEERSLLEAFPAPYREYQRQVRWRVVPGIW